MFDEVLLIGGAAGTGKTTVGWETLVLLRDAAVAHWHVEGDFLDSAWPRPPGDEDGSRLTTDSLRALGEVMGGHGYRRCVYVQTAALLDHELVRDALGAQVRFTEVLLTAPSDVRHRRLADREIGSALEQHLRSSDHMADRLDRLELPALHRIDTDHLTVTQVARLVVAATGWTASTPGT